MSIGEALTQARQQAGLTVAQVSARTRIRETIIRDIEADDYASCGGDFWARGHIRSIARVTGADPVALINEYDEARLAPPDPVMDTVVDRIFATGGSSGSAWSGEQESPDGWAAEQDSLDGWSEEQGNLDDGGPPTDPGYGYWPVTGPSVVLGRAPGSPGEHGGPAYGDGSQAYGDAGLSYEDAGAGQAGPPGLAGRGDGWPLAASQRGEGSTRRPVTPGPPAEPAVSRIVGWSAAPAPRGDRHRLAVTAMIGTALLAGVVIVIYVLIAGSRTTGTTASGAGRTAHRSTAPATPSVTPSATPTSVAPAPPAVQALHPVRVTAFGPDGAGRGDNPEHAPLAIDGSQSSAWRTDWYTTAAFGNLQPGTGLLLDMGRPVTITVAQVTLGGLRGADVQLRAGASPALASLRPMATAADAGGVVPMRLSQPATARYVLIWFTRLPVDSAGTFQGSISNIRLEGHP